MAPRVFVALHYLVLLVKVLSALNTNLIVDFAKSITNSSHLVVFGCSKFELAEISKEAFKLNRFVHPIDLGHQNNQTFQQILSRHLFASTLVVLDADCPAHREILIKSDELRYFNKSYQWLVFDENKSGIYQIFQNLTNIGLNSQLTYVEDQKNHTLLLLDVHSKGLHITAPLEMKVYAVWRIGYGFDKLIDLATIQGIIYRSDFNGLTLRGVISIDRENVTNNEDVKRIMENPLEVVGATPFTKYHYDMVGLLEFRLNFSSNYRITRGWAGRIGPTQYRLGLLGVVMRNEADIAASGAFDRLNRFAEFDTIHQGWPFQSAFLYRFTTDVSTKGYNGNFLAPFDNRVWLFSILTIIMIGFIWKITELIIRYFCLNETDQTCGNIFLRSIAAICQQGIEPAPISLSTRTITYSLIIFTLVIYNYYTSSVVGGLLSNEGKGPETLDQIIDSPLKLIFDDIGYHKVVFRELKTANVRRMYKEKVEPERSSNELPPFITIKSAIPYLKDGRYAFHCEVDNAYEEIAKVFDAEEICDLREVFGLLENQILNMILTKQSQYSEIFRIVLHRVREIGIMRRIVAKHKTKKPECQASYTVYPVKLSGVLSAFMLLGGGALASLLILTIEYWYYRICVSV